MTIDGLSDDAIRDILTKTRRIAMVGASNRPGRPSNGVLRFLLARGYDVTPVNPVLAGTSIHGRKVVATLTEAAPLEMVDVFRASDKVPDVMQEAIAHRARVVWMQLGVINEAAAEAGRKAGIIVVMDRCPAIEVPRLGIAA